MDHLKLITERSDEMGDSAKATDDGENVLQDQTQKISDDMDVSPKDSGDSKGVLQDQTPIPETIPTALGNQELSSVRQESAENQQLHSGAWADMFSQLSISSSQVLNIVQLDETLSQSDAFYSSRKLRIRTKCSRIVDALLLPQQNLKAFWDQSGEAGRNPATLGNQVFPSVRQDPSANQQLPSDVSIETSAIPSEIAISSSSQDMNIDLLDETFSDTGAFYTSRELQIRTNCSPRVDALLSPRQHSKDFFVTASDSKTRDGQKTAISSPQKRGVKKNRGPTPIKKRKTLESDSNKLASGKKSLIPKFQPVTSFTTPPKPRSEKIVGGYYRDPKIGNAAFKSKLSYSISAAVIDVGSPINLQTQKSEVSSQDVGESNFATQVGTSISFQHSPVDSKSSERISSTYDSHQTDSLIRKMLAELETVIRSKISTDTSITSINFFVYKKITKNRATQTSFRDRHPPSMSGHQCPIAGGSTGHRFDPPLHNKESREAKCAVNQSITSDDMVLKYVIKARENLVSLWREIIECEEGEELFSEFVDKLPFSSDPVIGSYMEIMLMQFLQKRTFKWDEKNVFTDREKTLEYHACDAYDVLIRIIVTALRSTLTDSSRRVYDSIIKNYESFKLLHERCSKFWNEENILFEASRSQVKALKEKIQRLMLETKTAFQDLLMHTGENAEQSQIDEYVEKVWEEDKKFLRLNSF